MKILTISDRVEPFIYSPAVKRYFGDVELVLGCGDLPYYYLEFIVTMLDIPLFYVIGNHADEVKGRYASPAEWRYPGGCQNIDGRIVRHKELLIAGLEGSIRYNNEPNFQYTEQEMARKIWGLIPSLLLNKLRYGRYLDILITHAPPQGIHDQPDRCHQGFQVFRTFMDRFQPRYLIHGHVHACHADEVTETIYRTTHVINTYGYRVLTIGGPMNLKGNR
ncbi:MAG: metallophosphoesterase [Anaerolineae bacterium]